MGAVLHAQPEPVSNAQLTQDVLRTVRAARQKATVTIDLKVYKEPPTQMFVFVTPAKEELATIKEGQEVTLLDREVVLRSFLEKSLWQKIEIPAQEAGSLPTIGWVYVGRVNGQKALVAVEGGA